MATLNIAGQRVTVDDAFLKLPREQQDAVVSDIASKLGAQSQPQASPEQPKQLDQYQQAAQDELSSLDARGVDPGAGLTRRLAHGATLGWDNTLLAGAQAPLEAIKRGVGLGEGYNYAKAREDALMERARKKTGIIGTLAEIGGGAGAGIGLARSGLSLASRLAPEANLLTRTGASAADAAGMGAVAGASEGDGLMERAGNSLKGAAIGGVTGAAVPPALAITGAVASPIVSNVRALANPQGYAERQLVRAIGESGMTPQQIAAEVQQAAREGQAGYTVADAMGNPGQRMLSTVSRAPGEGRTAVVDALEARQAGQGRRVANAISEGFHAPETAAQTQARMTSAREAAADTAYSDVRNNAGRVDVVPTLDAIDRVIGTRPGQVLTQANDSIEGALRPFRERLARVNPDDFEAVQRIRYDMADAAQSARQGGYGNRARLIGQAVRELDTAMEGASPGFRQAQANFRQASRDIEAIDQGGAAAQRGRVEDTIPSFMAMSPQGQQAFRAGYVDPLISQAQGAAFGANKARPLLNDAFAAEANAMAPGNQLMQRRLQRENTMFETRNQALGGSRTADNLADQSAMSVDPSFVMHVATGNWGGAMRHALNAGSNVMGGNTAAVRSRVADILLQNGANVSGAALQSMADRVVNQMRFWQAIARGTGRGAAGGLAIEQSQPNTRR